MSAPSLLQRAAAAILVLAAAAFAPATVAAEEITVFAAASMADALAEIEKGFERAADHDLIISLAGSSVLARQIQEGAPADVFISASPDWMDAIEAKGLIEPESRFDLLGNTLVLIAHGDGAEQVAIGSDLDLSDLLGNGRLAMALVDGVPAGVYGKAALASLGLWEDVEAQVAQTDNVRAALALVATGEAPYGIVYATDAAAEDSVTIVGTFPSESHPPIVYPAAALASRDLPAATRFLDYLRGPEARAAFEHYGFAVVAP